MNFINADHKFEKYNVNYMINVIEIMINKWYVYDVCVFVMLYVCLLLFKSYEN